MTEKCIKAKIKRIYGKSNGFKSERFYRDYSCGYRYALGERSAEKDIISISPNGSDLERLLRKKHYHDLNYDMENAVESAVLSLMHYGFAYIYIDAVFNEIENENGCTEKVLNSFQVGEVKGIITKKTKNNIEFWGFGSIGAIQKRNYDPKGLVEMNLRDMGYSKMHFAKIARKIDKYDITATNLIYNKNDGYEFSEHLRKCTIEELKATRDLGWMNRPGELSESQYYYRKIKQCKFKISMMNYVVDSINKSLQHYINLDSDGKITVNLNNTDYDELWEKYSVGNITSKELSAFF